MRHTNPYLIIGAALLCVAPVFFTACSGRQHRSGETITDRATTAVLEADTVTTLISDSGIVRYRISAPNWQIFDQVQPSYWEFANGIYLEKFNQDLQVTASLRADYARYWDNDERWELSGNVRALNEEGETFLTQQLNWDQKAERVYSDSAITINRQTSVIQGIGFESNQTMTQYTILNPTGYFPIDDE